MAFAWLILRSVFNRASAQPCSACKLLWYGDWSYRFSITEDILVATIFSIILDRHSSIGMGWYAWGDKGFGLWIGIMVANLRDCGIWLFSNIVLYSFASLWMHGLHSAVFILYGILLWPGELCLVYDEVEMISFTLLAFLYTSWFCLACLIICVCSIWVIETNGS